MSMLTNVSLWTVIVLLLGAAAVPGAAQAEAVTTGLTTLMVDETVDLANHILAHIDVAGSPASNFDPDYVESMAQRRAELGLEPGLAGDLTAFRKEAPKHMALWNVAMAAAFFESTPSYLAALWTWAGRENVDISGFSQQDQMVLQGLGAAFAQVPKEPIMAVAHASQLEYESFYSQYWPATEEQRLVHLQRLAQLWTDADQEFLESFFSQRGVQSIRIIASEAMLRNGRGFTDKAPGRMGVIVSLPASDAEAMDSYLLAIHELLHAITDPLVYEAMGWSPADRSLDPSDAAGYAIHEAIENAVIRFQLWLLQGMAAEKTDAYFAFFNVTSEEQLAEEFPVPDAVLTRLEHLRQATL